MSSKRIKHLILFTQIILGFTIKTYGNLNLTYHLSEVDPINYKYQIMPYLSLRNIGIDISGENQIRINLLPNVKSNVGIAASYGNYGFAYSVRMANSQKDPSIYGRTRYKDLSFSYFTSHFGGEVYYSKYQGFYGKNQEKEIQIFPGLRNRTMGLNIFYSFNKKYSLKAACQAGEHQLHSRGSFILASSYRYTRLSNFEKILETNGLPTIEGGKFHSLSLALGYGYTFTKRKIFLALGLLMGPGLEFRYIDKKDFIDSRSGVSFKMLSKSSLGFNGDRFFTFLGFSIDAETIFLRSFDLNQNVYEMSLNIGYRF